MAYFKVNTLWRDEQYYRNTETGQYMPKYVLILAISTDADDALGAVLTSKSNGLSEHPACDFGPPRAGYFLGTPGGPLTLPTWVDFSSIQDQESLSFKRRIASGRLRQVDVWLHADLFCKVLRCLSQSEDLSRRQHKWLADTLQKLG